MRISDDRLRSALQRTFATDDPGEEFDRRVMESVEAGGGEHVLSAADNESGRRRWLWTLAPVAAAAVLLVLLLLRGGGNGDQESSEAPSVSLADPAEGEAEPKAPMLLPAATRTEPIPNSGVEILVSRDGAIELDGKAVPLAKLAASLRESAGEDAIVRIRADCRVDWRTIQHVMQACAAARLRRLCWVVSKPGGGEEASVPVPLPTDGGLGPPRGEVLRSVRLVRRRGEKETTVYLQEMSLGQGDAGFIMLRELLRPVATGVLVILPDEIRAGRYVPYGEVVRTVDILREAGIEEILFQGAPPPPEVLEPEVIEDEVVEEEPAEEPPSLPRRSVRVTLLRKDGKTYLDIETSRTTGKVGDNPVINTKTSRAALETGLEVLRELLRGLTSNKLRVVGVLGADRDVPFGDAQRVLMVFEEFGIHDVAIDLAK